MLNLLSKISKFIDNYLKKITIFLTGVLSIVVFAQVICRYILGFSLFWSAEMARFLLVWITFIGGSVALRNGNLIGMKFVVNKVSDKIALVLTIIGDLLVMVFLYFVTYYGFSFALRSWEQVSPALGLSMGIVQMIIPVGTLIMFLHVLYSTSLKVKKLFSEE